MTKLQMSRSCLWEILCIYQPFSGRLILNMWLFLWLFPFILFWQKSSLQPHKSQGNTPNPLLAYTLEHTFQPTTNYTVKVKSFQQVMNPCVCNWPIWQPWTWPKLMSPSDWHRSSVWPVIRRGSSPLTVTTTDNHLSHSNCTLIYILYISFFHQKNHSGFMNLIVRNDLCTSMSFRWIYWYTKSSM